MLGSAGRNLVLTQLSLACNGRAPHWIMDAVLGGFVALGAITMAHAALPEKIALVSAPAPAITLAAARLLATPQEPAALISFQQPVPGRQIVSPFGLRQMPWIWRMAASAKGCRLRVTPPKLPYPPDAPS